MTDTRHTRLDEALVLPLQEALDTYRPRGVMPVHLGGLSGNVRVFEQDAHFASLDLDAAFFGEGCVGALFCRGLMVDTWLVQAEMDFGPFVHVNGDVRAQNLMLGGGYLHFAGDVTVEQTLLAGCYNHGYAVLGGQVTAPLVMTFDHGLDLDVSRLRAGVFLSDDDREGASLHEPGDVLSATYWDDDWLDERAVLKAMKAGRALIKTVPVSALQKRLDKARASKAGKADLSGLKLDRVPEAVQGIPGLKALDLSGNPLARVDEPLGSCPDLTTLSLARCSLAEVPDVLARLPQLESIDLSRNPITAIPPAWSALIHLHTLDMHGCDLAQVPDVLVDLPGLQHLMLHDQQDESGLRIERGFAGLRSLSFRGQLLSALPALKALTWGAHGSRALPEVVLESLQLERLDLRRAPRLGSLPIELAQLQHLKEVGLSLHDDFKDVEVLAHLPALRTLALCYREDFLPRPFYALLDMPQWTSLEIQGWMDDSSILRRLLERPNLKKLAMHDRYGDLRPVDIVRERRRVGLA